MGNILNREMFFVLVINMDLKCKIKWFFFVVNDVFGLRNVMDNSEIGSFFM